MMIIVLVNLCSKPLVNPKDGAELVFVPAATFQMGSDPKEVKRLEQIYLDATAGDVDTTMFLVEIPRRQVSTNAFWIYKYEVTNAQYKRFCDDTKRTYPEDPKEEWLQDYFLRMPNYPVVNVSFEDALDYAKWAEGDLPTEEEWERAARGTDGRYFPWGNSYPFWDKANYMPLRDIIGDGFSFTAPVGSYPNGRSPCGVFDMAGNVAEWCNSYFLLFNQKEGTSNLRVIRGGSWSTSFYDIRCAHRAGMDTKTKATDVGFRLVLRKLTEVPAKVDSTSIKNENKPKEEEKDK